MELVLKIYHVIVSMVFTNEDSSSGMSVLHVRRSRMRSRNISVDETARSRALADGALLPRRFAGSCVFSLKTGRLQRCSRNPGLFLLALRMGYNYFRCSLMDTDIGLPPVPACGALLFWVVVSSGYTEKVSFSCVYRYRALNFSCATAKQIQHVDVVERVKGACAIKCHCRASRPEKMTVIGHRREFHKSVCLRRRRNPRALVM